MNDADVDRLVESVAKRYKRINTYFLKLVGKRIKEIGDLRPTEIHRLELALTVEKDLGRITEILSEESGKSQKEIYKLLRQSADEDYEFAKQFYECRNIDPPAMADNTAVMDMVEAVCRQTGGAVSNLSLTTALGMKAENSAKEFISLSDSYKQLIDNAITAVQSGVIDYNTAIRNTLKSFSDSGIRSVEYESGYSRRIDSAVRMNLLDGVRQINQKMQDIVGEQFGADGVEISVHFNCAEDHLPYQGRQYSNEDFAKLQEKLKRPFGQWNCRHKRLAIVLGVSRPNYTDEELEDIRRYNRRMIDFEGKKLNIMQVRQLQSSIAAEMIKQQDRLTLFKSSGDKLGALEAQDRITQLNDELIKLDKAVKGVDNYGNSSIINVTSSNGILITELSFHSQERIMERAVIENDIRDALTNPLRICDIVYDSQGRPSQRFVGTLATVNVNPQTGVITTVWKTGKTTVKKLLKESSNE